ncbi:SRPBCC family protein [Nakamurella endophytica]|uniref:Polyketide cyclase n=1 Tax=Nakamurella endophytica TaxID=1748367 RepID=A0A917WCP0_9ACTN|nr:SRPBCC family protein [Nakamurella endophytica]GGL90251.1 hypothetical protein GCM10011594_07400 [Nakamurella endophytica]
MTVLACSRVVSSAPPEAFFDRWADTATWPEWNSDTEWVRMDGPFREGATGTLRPRGGPTVGFRIERLVPGREFVDVSRLPGARLTFAHTVTTRAAAGGADSDVPADGTRTEVSVVIDLSGPLAPVWRLVLGRGLRRSVHRDLVALARAAEAASTAGGGLPASAADARESA